MQTRVQTAIEMQEVSRGRSNGMQPRGEEQRALPEVLLPWPLCVQPCASLCASRDRPRARARASPCRPNPHTCRPQMLCRRLLSRTSGGAQSATWSTVEW